MNPWIAFVLGIVVGILLVGLILFGELKESDDDEEFRRKHGW